MSRDCPGFLLNSGCVDANARNVSTAGTLTFDTRHVRMASQFIKTPSKHSRPHHHTHTHTCSCAHLRGTAMLFSGVSSSTHSQRDKRHMGACMCLYHLALRDSIVVVLWRRRTAELTPYDRSCTDRHHIVVVNQMIELRALHCCHCSWCRVTLSHTLIKNSSFRLKSGYVTTRKSSVQELQSVASLCQHKSAALGVRSAPDLSSLQCKTIEFNVPSLSCLLCRS